MAYTDPGDAVTGVVAPASLWNTGVRDNFRVMPPHRLALKTSGTSRVSTTTSTNDPDLASIPHTSGERWWFWLFLPFRGGAGDIKFRFSWTGSGSLGMTAVWLDAGVTLDLRSWLSSSSPTAEQGLSVISSNDAAGPVVQGMFVSSGTGTISLQWAQNTSDATNTILDAGASWWGVVLA